MAVSQWKLTRMEVAEVNIFKDISDPEKQIPLLDRLWQAECRLERSYARAQRELERLQNSRCQPDPQTEEPAPVQEAETPSSSAAALAHPVPAAHPSPRVEPTSEIRNPTSE